MKFKVAFALGLSALAANSLAAQANSHPAATTHDHPTATTHDQSGTPTAATPQTRTDSSTVYDSQALRFESRWGSADIMRGAKGEVIGSVGWFRDFDVEKLLQSSPQAAAAAHDFSVSNFRGSLVTTIGASLVAIGLVVASNNSNNASTPVLIIAGAGGIGWGLQHISRSYAALSRAVWWYNRDLAR